MTEVDYGYGVGDKVEYFDGPSGLALPEMIGRTATVTRIVAMDNATFVEWDIKELPSTVYIGNGSWWAENFRKVSDTDTVKETPVTFQKGDRVRIIKTYDDSTTSQDGKLATFVKHNPHSSACPFQVDVDDDFTGWNVFSIELVESVSDNDKESTVPEIKIGDKVRIVKTYHTGNDDYNHGETGTFTGMYPDNGAWAVPMHKVTLDKNGNNWNAFKVELIEYVKENDVTVNVDVNEVEALKAELELIKKSTDGLIGSLRTQYNDIYRKHESFRSQVAQLANDTYDNGDGPWWESGYREAMETLGLESFMVGKPFEVTLTIHLRQTSLKVTRLMRLPTTPTALEASSTWTTASS